MIERALSVGTGLRNDAFVFSSEPDGSSPWRPDSVTHRWSTMRATIGLPSMRLHDLRHFQATMLLKAGVPVKNVSGRIGHRDAATTLNVYAHALTDLDETSAQLIGRLLPGRSADVAPTRLPTRELPELHLGRSVGSRS
jgi:integrase